MAVIASRWLAATVAANRSMAAAFSRSAMASGSSATLPGGGSGPPGPWAFPTPRRVAITKMAKKKRNTFTPWGHGDPRQ